MRKYKIGITFNLEGKTRDIWANGAGQNVIFLYNLLKKTYAFKKKTCVFF